MLLHLRLGLLLGALVLAFGVVERAISLSLVINQTVVQESQILQAYANDQIARLAERGAGTQPGEIEALLRQSLSYHPEVGTVRWEQSGKAVIRISNPVAPPPSPDWLNKRLAAIAAQSGLSQAQGLASTSAGRLSASANQAWFAHQIWQSFLAPVWMWLMATLGSFALGFFLFKRHLAGLRELAHASKSFLTEPAFQIAAVGSADIRKIARTLNAMSNTMKKIRDVAKSKVELSNWYANHDALTRLPNRDLLLDRLTQALGRCKREQETMALCRINLDNFQALNNRHGHGVGDLVLAGLAERLSQNLRQGDTLARIGGDEFALLLTNLKSEDEALSGLERFLAILEQPLKIEDFNLRVTASAGISIQEPVISGTGQVLLDAHQILSQSSRLIHMAKSGGAKQIRTWRDDLINVESIEQQWANRLYAAVSNDELLLHYQPKVDIATGQIVGLEALVRWQHPNLGLLMPGAFLPHVEATDAIVLTGKWALLEAIRQMSVWLEEGHGWHVSVNVAARQLTEPAFISNLKSALASYPTVAPQRLTLEILETSALEDLAHVRTIVETIQQTGVSCSLDDFGTGYSSLTYLKQLPVDEVKIDQSFVRGMLDDNGDLAVVEGVITLCKVFDRRVVAEGVETLEHGALLHRLGCRIMQGWAIAKAMPGSDIPAFVRNFATPRLWQDWGKTNWNLSHFPVLVANQDLDSWLDRVAEMALGGLVKLSDDPTENYLQSRLGAWYQRTGKAQFGHVPGVPELDLQHRALHVHASEFLLATGRGEDKSTDAILQDLREKTEQFKKAMDLLRQQVITPSPA